MGYRATTPENAGKPGGLRKIQDTQETEWKQEEAGEEELGGCFGYFLFFLLRGEEGGVRGAPAPGGGWSSVSD